MNMFSSSPYATSPAPCVLVINTGGTFGMKKNRSGALAPASHQDLMNHLISAPIFGTYDRNKNIFTVTPRNNRRLAVSYKLEKLNELLDSSNMDPSKWNTIAEKIQRNYRQYTGFVVIHGTDTMVYTASALSFMFENLGKPVVITGAQRPIFDSETDAEMNLIDSIVVAGTQSIPEVLLCFDKKVFRGNRCVKIDCTGFDAFDSPNHPPLIKLGETRLFSDSYPVGENPRRQQNWYGSLRVVKMTPEDYFKGTLPVGILRLYPGITTERAASALEGMQAIVLQSFGAGNIPEEEEFLCLLEDFIKNHDYIIINVTQCLRGTVTSDYVSGSVIIVIMGVLYISIGGGM